MQGSLFTQDFLLEGIIETEDWKSLDAATATSFRNRLAAIFAAFPVREEPNEATTERDLIDKILGALGWTDFLVQQSAGGRRSDVPDYLLFADGGAKTAANKERKPERRYLHGLSILEAKRWRRPLDRGREPDLLDDDVPSTQMLRYMTRTEIASERRIQWGILTNGRHWRLYFQGARSRSEEFLELDLPILAGIEGVERDLFSPDPEQSEHLLKVFLLMFRREAFLPRDDGRAFHGIALDEGRHWEARVADDLSDLVFERVFPALVGAIAAHDREAPSPFTQAYLDEARVAALTLLYRLLFVFYAEDRALLPTHDSRYDDYALRRIREDIRDKLDRRDTLSATQGRYHNDLKQLFGAIHAGDEALGLPPYNGGLFAAHPVLDRVAIPDADMAAVIDALSRGREGDSRKWINYRDLSVQQLGSIYERLLEYIVVMDDSGKLAIRPNVFARKTSGSYYTHQDLVTLIVDRAVRPLLEERESAFHKKAIELRTSRRPKAERIAELERLDPASAFLELKICDPAMGSGHFLVSLVDYLADAVLEAMTDAAATVDWADPESPYRSPLVDRIADIRARILKAARTARWSVDEEQLDDRHIVRRMILKRCVYGVDKNPMAVELAKVSLWLHTFTVGAPLSFLDHHLRCGDSLYGEFVRAVEDIAAERAAMFLAPVVTQARNAAKGMAEVERLTDADIAEVRTSASTFHGVEEATAPLTRFMDFVHAVRWLEPVSKDERQVEVALLSGTLGDPIAILSGQARPRGKQSVVEAANSLLARAAALAEECRFFHWEVAFPGVWTDWESAEPHGGFNAVIGNPPWDRIKLQDVEWFAARKPEIAHTTRAADRKRMIAEMERSGDPLWRDYLLARDRADRAAAVARQGKDYPLLSSGDINIYSLFVERAHRLIAPTGMVGLLTPSGIASDLGASKFFRSISTSGRLAALFDFENKKVFFPDVDSRFKFCAYIAGGKERRFGQTDCAFYLHRIAELDDPERCFALSANDFARVNPNTGTAPVFRTRRDAAITTTIYSRVPVLVDRRHQPPTEVWPIRYSTMFHMTNDSGLFKTAEELEASGYYHVDGNRYRRGESEFLPLYVGKMVNQFQHRAADVGVNPENLHNAALSDLIGAKQLADPAFTVTPQFWVDNDMIELPAGLEWAIGFRDIARGTDIRTVIAAVVPKSGVGNTLPLILSDETTEDGLNEYLRAAPFLVGNLNSLVLDFVARQKVQSTHVNWYIVEQLPVLPAESYRTSVGRVSCADLVRREVLRLTYTAHDLAPFARDMGYDGVPFPWDEEDRRHRRARLDALFFMLYGIGENDAAYILDTFPILKREDEAAFGGRYLTKDLVLGYMKALAAGDAESRVSVNMGPSGRSPPRRRR